MCRRPTVAPRQPPLNRYRFTTMHERAYRISIRPLVLSYLKLNVLQHHFRGRCGNFDDIHTTRHGDSRFRAAIEHHSAERINLSHGTGSAGNSNFTILGRNSQRIGSDGFDTTFCFIFFYTAEIPPNVCRFVQIFGAFRYSKHTFCSTNASKNRFIIACGRFRI